MHKHMEREAYLRVLRLIGIYSGKRPKEHATIMDAKGKQVKGTGEKLEVCAVFFDKLYNCVPTVKLPAKAKPEELRPPPEPPLHLGSPPLYSSVWAQGLPLPGPRGDLGIDMAEPTFGEVVKGLNNNKVLGANGVMAELFKFAGEAGLMFVHECTLRTWHSGKVPEDWKRAQIVILHKNGSRANLDNYMGINLLDIINKVYTRVLLGQLKVAMDTCLNEAEMGFCLGRSCSIHLQPANKLVQGVQTTPICLLC
jgi:hypothetical protein